MKYHLRTMTKFKFDEQRPHGLQRAGHRHPKAA